ncbi:hypothetical protein NKH77_53415 [Streptomyces sp. M19]
MTARGMPPSTWTGPCSTRRARCREGGGRNRAAAGTWSPALLVTGRSLPSFCRLTDIGPLLALCHPEVLLEEGDLVLDRTERRHRLTARIPPPAVERVRRDCADVVASCDGRLLASTRRACRVRHGVRHTRDAVGIGTPTGPSTRLVVFGEAPPELPGTERRALRAFGATLLTVAGRARPSAWPPCSPYGSASGTSPGGGLRRRRQRRRPAGRRPPRHRGPGLLARRAPPLTSA